jgi:hypothetical protein
MINRREPRVKRRGHLAIGHCCDDLCEENVSELF